MYPDRRTGLFLILVTMLLAVPCTALGGVMSEPAGSDENVLDLSLEDLLGVKVTSVSKRSQPLHDAAAAVFVITAEDLERRGVTSIPEALSMVPGIHVGRIDANKWAVTSRGFNGRFSNKLLVLIDGRSVYTPAFSGVYWEQEDVMIEDVDRIEIIRGPGSTLWGANAVNGVINIITKHAADTQGGLAVGGAGDYEQGFGAVRYGTRLGEGTFARFYGKAFSRDQFKFQDGQDAADDWQMYRSGFRIDAQQGASRALTFQGEIYSGTIDDQVRFAQLTPPYEVQTAEEIDVSGGNVLGRWTKTLSPTAEFALQVYFNRAVRDEAMAYQATGQVDYDFQHHFQAGKHALVWGAGYRHTTNDVKMRRVVLENAGAVDLDLYSIFIQDELSLWNDRASLIAGSKFEHNDYTGAEVQPSVRFIWRARDKHRIWAAVSRAVRTPMRAEDNLGILAMVMPPETPSNPAPLPVGIMVTGNGNFSSEELIAYEVGYRFTLPEASADITMFYNDYEQLQTSIPGDPEMRFMDQPPHILQPMVFSNGGDFGDYGVEAALSWQAGSWLRWDLAYSLLKRDVQDGGLPHDNDILAPENMLNFSWGFHPSAAIEGNISLRYVDECWARQNSINGNFHIPSYTTLDAALNWRLYKDVKVSLVGRNLLDEDHMEYVAESFSIPTVVPRSYYAKVRWSF